MKNMPPTEPKEKPAPPTKAQKALKMKAELQTLLEDAKTEALEAVNAGIKELGELGFIYRLLSEEEYANLIRPQIAPETPKQPRSASKAPAKAKEPAPAHRPTMSRKRSVAYAAAYSVMMAGPTAYIRRNSLTRNWPLSAICRLRAWQCNVPSKRQKPTPSRSRLQILDF